MDLIRSHCNLGYVYVFHVCHVILHEHKHMFKISILDCKNLSVSLYSNDLIPAGQCFISLEVPTEPKDLRPLSISKYSAR